MPEFELVAPDGSRHALVVPEGATQEQIQAKAQAAKAALAQKTAEPPKRTWKGEILPVGGAVLGGMTGGALGAASPLPGGAYAGGVAGTAAGGAAGEAAQQGIERLMGQREAMAPGEIAKAGAEQGAMEAVGAPVASVAGRLLKPVAARAMEAVLPLANKAEARLVQGYRAAKPFWQRVFDAAKDESAGPRTVTQTILDKGLYGGEAGLGIQAKRASKKIWNETLQPALRASQVTVDLPSFWSELEQRVIKENPELNRQADLLDALKALKEPYEQYVGVSPEGLQKLKEGWAKFVPQKVYQGKPIEGAFKEVKNKAAGLAREKIYDALGEGSREAYLDYGNLQRVIEHGQRVMTGGQKRGGFGGFWSSIKDAAVTPVATIGGQIVYQTGNGLELVGAPGARVVRDILPGIGDVGKDVSGKPAPGQPAAQPAPTPQPPSPTATPGPATKLAYQLNAQQTLGGPDADANDVKTVADMHREVAKGKTPDVQQDLRTGRLSIPAISQTLRVSGTPVTQKNVGAMLQNVGPDEAMHMLGIASEDERQWLEPLVRQKLEATVANPKVAPWLRKQTQEMLMQLGAQG